ncbi:hypothetical protein [Aureimonas sp. Leaf454]|uniref:hypothetical protein n=1 Tax=Aureimonas sp. Leaf454 TaxID=1736381 RepID=UPI0012E3B9B9|nr:hypothetical protein [Aureimonas sp. Leaf454]
MVLGIIFDWIGYRTARWLLPLVSSGAWRVEQDAGRNGGHDWKGTRRRLDAVLEFSRTISEWIGVFVWSSVFALLIVLRESVG